MAIGFTGVSPEREKVVDYTEPYYVSERTFARQFPQVLPKAYAYTYPFDFITWIGILISLLIASIAFSIINSRRSYISILLDLFGSIFHQGITKEKDYNRKQLLGNFLWFSFIVSSSYSAVLASILALPPRESAPNNFEELGKYVKQNQYKVVAAEGTVFENDMLNSGNENLINIAKTMRKNNWFVPIHDVNDEKKLYHKTAFLKYGLFLRFMAGPEIFVSDDSIKSVNIAMIVNKQFCCKKEIDSVIRKINYSGLYQRIIEDEIYKAWIRSSKANLDEQQHALSLVDVTGPFIVLLCGYCFSVIVLFIEMNSSVIKKI